MCEELKDELNEGKDAATRVVEHLLRMGADRGTIPVIVDDEKYEVEVRHVPVVPEPVGRE